MIEMHWTTVVGFLVIGCVISNIVIGFVMWKKFFGKGKERNE